MFAFIWDDLVWIVPVLLIALCYITGDLAQIIFQMKKGICFKVLSGFVLLLCLFHLICLPFMFSGWSFMTLHRIFLGMMGGVIVCYAVLSIVKKRIPLKDDVKGIAASLRSMITTRWWVLLLWILVLALIIWHVAQVILHVRYNVDDNFYVAESLTNLSRDRLMDVLPSCGIEGSVFPATYILVSWEAFLASLSSLFSVSPAALCHSILPALLLPLHYMAYYAAGREFAPRKTSVFLCFVVFLNLTCGPSTYNQGAFLTLRIWQGKAVLVNILLPLLLVVFLRITKTRKIRLPQILFLFSILLASQAATTVGAYLTPVLYAVYAVTFLILSRKWNPFWKLFLPAAGITPFVLWKVWILLKAGTLGDLSEGSGVYDRSFTELAMNYFGFSLVILFFIVSLIILCVLLNKGEARPLRFFFLIASLLLIICFINPLTMPFTERFITGVGVYWRMFWLLQITIVIAAAFTLLTSVPKMKLAGVTVFLFLLVVTGFSGRSIFKDEDIREKFDNPAKVSKTTIGIVSAIRNDIREEFPELSKEERAKLEQKSIVLLPRSLSLELRQYADISLLYYAYYSNNYYAYQTEEDYILLQNLYGMVYNQKSWKASRMESAVRELGIDYIAIGSETAERNQDNIPESFDLLHKGKRYTLYKTNSGQ